MRRLRHAQPSLWEDLLAEEAADLWEPWMREAYPLLEDEDLLNTLILPSPPSAIAALLLNQRECRPELAFCLCAVLHAVRAEANHLSRSRTE